MATISYLLQSKSDNAPIYIRLNLNAKTSIKRKTGLVINPSQWSKKTKLPLQNNSENKNITSLLKKLNTHIFDCYNSSIENNDAIDGNWLVKKIDSFFNRSEEKELQFLTDYGKHFLGNLKNKIDAKTNKKGVAESTEKKYKTIVNKLIAFEEYKKTRYRLIDVNLNFRDELINYFDEIDNLSDNTIGRYLKFVKTICLDAEKRSQPVSKELKNFQGFTIKAPKVVLTKKEIKTIINSKIINETHEMTRDWLIIGIYTGQRVSDLLRMNKTMIKRIKGFDFIVLTQIKTGKKVQIPLHQRVKDVLKKREGDFPPTFVNNVDSNKALFNRHLKSFCRDIGVNTIVEGNKFNDETKRYEKGNYEKHLLVSSHICRRTFATIHYGKSLYPTPLLMNITAHSTEKMFLEYIGKKPLDYSLQLAKIWKKVAKKEKQKAEKKQVKLTVIKNAN